MEEKTLEELCNDIRGALKEIEMKVRALAKSNDLNAEQTFEGQRSEQQAQAMLAVRHLEDARMRLGKVIQYNGNGYFLLRQVTNNWTGRVNSRMSKGD